MARRSLGGGGFLLRASVVSLEFSNARWVPVGGSANKSRVLRARMMAYGMLVIPSYEGFR
jgi:hypothetical protein